MTAQLPQSMVNTYVERRKKELSDLILYVEEKNLPELRRIGHQWAGNARNYGFTDLEALGVELESLEDDTCQTQAPILLDKFKSWLNRF